MKVLVTGSNGFIGKNLVFRLNEMNIEVKTFTRENSINELKDLIRDTDCIVHLAGVNRSKNVNKFDDINVGLTASICEVIQALGHNTSIIFASSTQANLNNMYGKSKLDAETLLKKLDNETSCSVYIYRLPNVFGKWCKPNYNSVVATFCNNVSQDLPIQIHDHDTEITLIYIDDVIEEFVKVIQGKNKNKQQLLVQPEYNIKIGNLANRLIFSKKVEIHYLLKGW